MDGSSFASAYALSTIAGVRPFVTLALASLAVHFGWIHLARGFAGLGTDGATAVLLLLAVVELLADKVPGVDHALHVLHFATKPVAAALIVQASLPPEVPPALALGATALGVTNALGVHASLAAVRGGSSALTLGLANPVVSFLEDAFGTVVFALAFLAPAAGATIALAVTVALAYLAYHALRAIARRRDDAAAVVRP